MRWKVTAAERPSGHWRHQDRHMVQEVSDGVVITVIDGHGGSDDSIIRCCEVLPDLIADMNWQNAEAALVEIVKQLVFQTKDHEDGACISLAYLDNDGTAFLATLGDTFACAGKYDHEDVSLKWLRPQDLGGNESERMLHQQLGHDVALGYLRSPNNNLSLSRCLGHRDLKDKLFRHPAILKTIVTPGGFAILGTDGYFSMSEPECMHMKWLSCVRQKWEAQRFIDASFHSARTDDATVVVAYYD